MEDYLDFNSTKQSSNEIEEVDVEHQLNYENKAKDLITRAQMRAQLSPITKAQSRRNI